MFSLDGYRAIRTTGGAVRRTDRGVLTVSGRDRATWLQGLVTNDVATLAEGQSCYAAYLTPQGRMITDMTILACAPRLWLDVPAPLVTSLRDRLDRLVFSEDVQVSDESASRSVWTVFDPAIGPDPVTVFAQRGPGVPEDVPDTIAVPKVDLETYEVVRIEDGVPKFLVDMTAETIPLEAGIEDRAISFTKGCYVGQEVIVRVTHRGGGRVAKKLVRWKAEGLSIPPEARILSGERDIGRVTSAAFSPDQNAIVGLGYVHRDFVESGTEVTILWNDVRAEARIR